jgi:hypothetical protein
LLGLGLYAVNLGGTYIYDDVDLVYGGDLRVQHPRLWGQFWTRDYFHGGLDQLYRPLVSQSFGLQWWLHGDRPWAFHLVNILLHAGVAAAVAELGRRLAGWRVGLIAGTLFAAHPVHVEAVAAIVSRTELACALGVLCAMVVFLRRPMTVARAFGVFALSVVAMLSKEQGMLIPALLVALLLVRRPQPASERQGMMWLAMLLLWSVSGLIVLREEVLHLKFEWARVFLDWTIQPLMRSHGADRWLIPIALVGRYFRLLVLPTRLSIDYGAAVIQPTIRPSDPYLLLGAAVISAWIIGAIVCLLGRRWLALFCLLAMAITYSMVANIILIADIFAERLVYLPSAFFLILVAMGLARLPGRAWIAALLILLGLSCLRSYTYARQWNDRDGFYAYSLAHQPASARIQLLTAEIARQEGRLDDARQILLQGRNLIPDYWQLWLHAGAVEEDAGNYALAVDYYRKAFDMHPSNALGDCLARAEQKMRRSSATSRSTR